jgi:geranylgeranyl pyrophosphate synthase
MTHAVLTLHSTGGLAELLEREFAPQALAETLGGMPHLPHRLWQTALSGPLQEMATRPSKQLRADLVEAAWRMSGGRGELRAEIPAIVEALHLGSLIIDDIEDGSPRRRGGPALHTMVGVPLALNAGNWLYFLPGLLIERLELPRAAELCLRQATERAALRCHYGQALDLSTSVLDLRTGEVPNVVLATTRLKTGALTELATRLGALAAGADAATVDALGRFGGEFGVGLQMLDDLGGLLSEKRCHKGHEDLLQARPTWPWAWLAARTSPAGYLRLRVLGEWVVAGDLHPEILAEQLREHVGGTGLNAARAQLESAVASLRTALGERPGLDLLSAAVQGLESFCG